jgi:hypothetical protein
VKSARFEGHSATQILYSMILMRGPTTQSANGTGPLIKLLMRS